MVSKKVAQKVFELAALKGILMDSLKGFLMAGAKVVDLVCMMVAMRAVCSDLWKAALRASTLVVSRVV